MTIAIDYPDFLYSGGLELEFSGVEWCGVLIDFDIVFLESEGRGLYGSFKLQRFTERIEE